MRPFRGGRSRRAALGAFAAATLLSCTALPPPQEWGRELVDEALPAPAPRASVEAIDRLTWRDAIRLAGEQSPTVAAASERIRRAAALVDEAAALAYPTVDARASHVRFIEAASFRGRSGSDVSGPSTRTRFFTGRGSDIFNAGVDVSYPLFDGGDAYYARRAAESSLEASRRDAEEVRQTLELAVYEAFLDILLSDGEIRIAEESLEFTRDQERLARARQDAGEGLAVDTLRFATRASEEQLALNRARATRTVRLAVLAELLGARLADDVELVRPDAALEVPEGDIVEIALDVRPEVRALRARGAEVRSRLSRSRARWWPSFNLFGSYGVLRLDDYELSQEDDELQIGAAMSLNLFEGGATAARDAALRHELAEIEQRNSELALRIEREVRQAEADLDVARRNTEVSQETVRLAEEVLDQVSAQYGVGEAQVIDVTEATLQRTRARLALLRSQLNLLRSQATLRRTAGLGVVTPETQ